MILDTEQETLPRDELRELQLHRLRATVTYLQRSQSALERQAVELADLAQ